MSNSPQLASVTLNLPFDLVDLRLMVRIAEADSLTRGAEAACLSAPAASTRIKALEESLGVRLLHRHPQGVTLTPAGQAFVHHARLVLGQLEHLRADLREYARGIRGHLRVHANTTALGEFLPPVLRRYLLDHPDVSVDLQERLSHDIVRAVSEGQADLGIVAGLVRTENLQTLPYRHDRLVLVLPRGHALAGLSAIAFADTLDCDHIGLAESSAIRAFLQQICAGLGRPMKQRIQVSNFEAACRMVEAAVGVAVLPESAARRHAQTMAVAIVPLADPWAERALQIVVRSLQALPAYARELVDLLVADARAAAPGG